MSMPADAPAIKALIVDDEKKAVINLHSLLLEYVDPEMNIAGLANSTAEAEDMIAIHKPDVLFLDIEMPNENAFGFLERISPVNFEVIFVTAYDEHALKAFKLNAIDYILKPISIPELRNAYAKLKQKLEFKKLLDGQRVAYSELHDQVKNKAKSHKITLRGTNSIEVVDFKDILFVEAQSSYSRIVFFKNNTEKEMLLSNPLSEYEEMLPESMFYRIHRSFLINCGQIKKISCDGATQVLMKNNLSIPVSRRRYTSLISYLETHDYV
jgi:two-component system LytT family response regulator